MRMKLSLRYVLLCSIVLLLVVGCSHTKSTIGVQEKTNQSKPSIKRFDFKAQENGDVRIRFDLEDPENESLDIELYYSLDSGYSYQSAEAIASGDIGDSIVVGKSSSGQQVSRKNSLITGFIYLIVMMPGIEIADQPMIECIGLGS